MFMLNHLKLLEVLKVLQKNILYVNYVIERNSLPLCWKMIQIMKLKLKNLEKDEHKIKKQGNL